MKHEFTLWLEGSHHSITMLEHLYAAGFDDALLGCENGKAYLDLEREAVTYDAAVAHATEQLNAAGFEVERVEEISP